MLNGIKSNNAFVTRIKLNTSYQTIKESELPEHKDGRILKDEIIQLNSK